MSKISYGRGMNNPSNSIGKRMREQYEDTTCITIPRRSYTIIRIDGRSFKNYTKKLNKPFDNGLIEDMSKTATFLCKNIVGARFAYVHSDEISILLTDFENINTEGWFGNNLQKMCSISASMATAEFNKLRVLNKAWKIEPLGAPDFYHFDVEDIDDLKFAEFDSRVFQIPQRTEVENYFIWRQIDCMRNSIMTVAQSLYSQKELNRMNQKQQLEMIIAKGQDWNSLASKYKTGQLIVKENYYLENSIEPRSRWAVKSIPVFTKDRNVLTSLIPVND